jgi:hypothetical protein
MNLKSAINAIAPLNAWARCDYEEALGMQHARSAVYAMKERVITQALEQGECKLRIVQVERPCKVCEGTGLYKRHDPFDEDYYEYEDCRRCQATGKVTLQFAEASILGAKFHMPRPKADFLQPSRLDWDKAEETD